VGFGAAGAGFPSQCSPRIAALWLWVKISLLVIVWKLVSKCDWVIVFAVYAKNVKAAQVCRRFCETPILLARPAQTALQFTREVRMLENHAPKMRLNPHGVNAGIPDLNGRTGTYQRT